MGDGDHMGNLFFLKIPGTVTATATVFAVVGHVRVSVDMCGGVFDIMVGIAIHVI